MKIKTYGLDDIKRAERLAREARDLHLIPVPVVRWEFDVLDSKGRVERRIRGKSNSYTRNGLNLIALHGGYVAPSSNSSYADGSLAMKNLSGTVRTSSITQYMAVTTSAAGVVQNESYESLVLGYGNTAESIDDYALVSEFGSGSSVNQLQMGTTAHSVVWNTAGKKWVSDYYRVVTNGYGSSQDIKEMGLKLYCDYGWNLGSQTSELFMLLRDVLPDVITIASGQSMIVHYKLETAY